MTNNRENTALEYTLGKYALLTKMFFSLLYFLYYTLLHFSEMKRIFLVFYAVAPPQSYSVS